MAAGYFEVMFTQQVASYNQDLGVTNTAPMQMNWLLRSEAYAWYFLPPISSILILWWYVDCLSMQLVFCLASHCDEPSEPLPLWSLKSNASDTDMQPFFVSESCNHDSRCSDT
jgi:hypothetical protein